MTFNARALSLVQSRFMMVMLTARTGVDVLCKGAERPWWRLNVPDEEQAKAFILDYRLFFQNTETISICNMHKLFDSEASLAPFLEEFNSLRDAINRYLDQKAFDDPCLTNRQIQDAFLYGWFAHGNQSQKALIAAWRNVEPTFAFQHHRFYCVIAEVCVMIQRMRMLNGRVLLALDAPTKTEILPDGLVIRTYN